MQISRSLLVLFATITLGYVAKASALPPSPLTSASPSLLSRSPSTCSACNNACTSTCTLCQPQCITPTPKSCDFYATCLEASIPCGLSGYALAYGGKNCLKFITNKALFSPAGQNWYYSVMTCLQNALIPVISVCDKTYSQISTAAFGSHARCYIKNGFCDKLELTDYVAVLYTVGTDLIGLEPIKEVLVTVEGCAEKFSRAVEGLQGVGMKGFAQSLNAMV